MLCKVAEILERATGKCWSHAGRRVDGAIQMISNQGGEIAYLSINVTRLIIQPVGSMTAPPKHRVNYRKAARLLHGYLGSPGRMITATAQMQCTCSAAWATLKSYLG